MTSWIPMGRPKRGYETRYEDLFHQVHRGEAPSSPGVLQRLFGFERAPTEDELAEELHDCGKRLRKIAEEDAKQHSAESAAARALLPNALRAWPAAE